MAKKPCSHTNQTLKILSKFFLPVDYGNHFKIYLEVEKIICEGLTAWEWREHIGCQTEQVIFDKTTNIVFY